MAKKKARKKSVAGSEPSPMEEKFLSGSTLPSAQTENPTPTNTATVAEIASAISGIAAHPPVVPNIQVPDIAGPAAGDMSSVLDAIKNAEPESLESLIKSGRYIGNVEDLQRFVDALHRPRWAAQHIMDRIKRLREIDNEITQQWGQKVKIPDSFDEPSYEEAYKHLKETSPEMEGKPGFYKFSDIQKSNVPIDKELFDYARTQTPEWMQKHQEIKELKSQYEDAVREKPEAEDIIKQLRKSYIRLKDGRVVPVKMREDLVQPQLEKLRKIMPGVLDDMQAEAAERRQRGLMGQVGDLAGYGAGRLVGKLGSMLVRHTPNPLMSMIRPVGQYGSEYLANLGGAAGIGMGAAAIGGGVLLGLKLKADEENKRRLIDLEVQSHKDMMDLMHNRAIKASMQSDINDNLARLQSQAPEIYMRVAAGRLLPQGAVVIGGSPRQDLLQQLGMSMANGQFGR